MAMEPQLQLLSRPGDAPGSLGFKLTGRARSGAALCRVWLRRAEPWNRYLDPRQTVGEWDVRVFIRRDSAFEQVPEFTLRDLSSLAGEFRFSLSSSSGLSQLRPNGDSIHDQVLAWAQGAVAAA